MTLGHGERAHAGVYIASVSTPAFKAMVKKHGGSCGPVNADGIVLTSSKYTWWPFHYFALPEEVPVCTKGYYNVAGGVITKVLSPTEERQADYQAALGELKSYLATWRLEGPTIANQLVVPSQRGNTLRLRSGRVTTSSLYRWYSAKHLVLLVTLDLHFIGSQGAWSSGANTRYVSFTQPSNGPTGQYLIAFYTGFP